MMKQYLINSVFSLSLISLAQAADLSVEEQCIALGYNTKISVCDAAGSAALLCPLNDGYSSAAGNDGNNMAVCITDSCRGYPLYKKNGKYYYLDQSGNEVEAVPSKGQLTDHMDGSFETCVAGYGNNVVTYYRVPKCKGEALYNNYFCDVGCDTEKKYPYAYHPGSTAGTVQKCVTADQTYYGYSSCNKGWVGGWTDGGIGRCGLDDCEMVDYPYPSEPNVNYYKENRGKTETCKIGGASYYRYTECNGSDFVLKGVNTRDRKGTVCARKCPVTDCKNTPFTNTYPNGDTAVINDWSCKIINTKCTVGDIATLNGKEIGTILSKEYELSDGKIKTLIVPTNYSILNNVWASGIAASVDLPQLRNEDTTTWGKIQTTGIMLAQQQNGYSFPATQESSLNYAPCESGICAKGEWYLPSYNELLLLIKNKYILTNSVGSRNLYNNKFWSSSELYNQAASSLSLGTAWGVIKTQWNAVLPYLAF